MDPGYEVDIGSFPKQIDLEADDSPVIVNEWVKNQTNGMIGLIVPGDKPLYNTRHGNLLQSTQFISKHHGNILSMSLRQIWILSMALPFRKYCSVKGSFHEWRV